MHGERGGDFASIGDEDLLEHRKKRRLRRFLIRKSFCPYSTLLPFWAKISVTVPAHSDSISFINFIASMMPSVCPGRTTDPTSTNAGASGDGDRKKLPTNGPRNVERVSRVGRGDFDRGAVAAPPGGA